jgi:hypothetical protein
LLPAQKKIIAIRPHISLDVLITTVSLPSVIRDRTGRYG